MKQGTVRLEAGATKNDEPRVVYMTEELKEVFQQQLEHRHNLLPYVFVNSKGTDRVKRFDKACKKACSAAGVGPK